MLTTDDVWERGRERKSPSKYSVKHFHPKTQVHEEIILELVHSNIHQEYSPQKYKLRVYVVTRKELLKVPIRKDYSNAAT